MFERYDPRNYQIDTELLIEVAVTLGGAVLIALALHWLAMAVLRRVARHSINMVDDAMLARVRKPLRWVMLGIAISAAAHGDALVGDQWDAAARFIMPALIGWLLYASVKGISEGLQRQFDAAADPVALRAQRTRLAILARTVNVAVVIITVSLIMLNIPGVRDIGTAMLASAGLAALAVGAAAQPALKSLIGGLQMALTQPLRIGDMVKLDGEVGRVEEIRMSFVTVRTWDERVLVVPTVRFLEDTFENWSRISEKLTAPVFLHLDPATDVGPIRTEFERFVTAHELYDGRNLALLMTEAYPESIELRLAMSAGTIGDLWTLRCEVREHMLHWLQNNMPGALIRHRLEVEAANARATGG
ncbi:mechanosensitive ion channel protein MscS [Erythrobacter sp. HI0063]|jgi:small-conductance mechanosensitive channel|uniref:mechanosensitive ion channel family protein n=1 Tax=Erythrobacter sp. HI0063 TaxID=1822240 RepID=UPI0007C3B968|nr:mechanosensitive ion channel domain-containing protein [Erythrobacter sp. HI0063]KZY56929.1 mechanosensitive ion channel protein MscS [Erythrobacter sp. HI0063]